MIATTISKKQLAAQLFKNLTSANKSRKEIIFEMMEQAGLTTNGASTYYANFKSGAWSLDANDKVAQELQIVPIEQVELMSNFELFEYYNHHAGMKLNTFPGRDTLLGLIRHFSK